MLIRRDLCMCTPFGRRMPTPEAKYLFFHDITNCLGLHEGLEVYTNVRFFTFLLILYFVLKVVVNFVRPTGWAEPKVFMATVVVGELTPAGGGICFTFGLK